jgi:hypothetical protein
MEETNWFGIEARVRGIVREITEPTIKRVHEMKEINEKLMRKDESLQDRMTSLEITLSQTNQRLENLMNFTSKIVEAEANMRTFEGRTASLFEKTSSKIDLVEMDTLNLSEKLGVLDKQRVLIEENAAGLEQNLLFTKSSIEKSLESIQEKSLKQFESTDLKLKTLDNSIKQINRKIESISSDLAETDYLSKKGDKVIQEHSERFQTTVKTIQSNKKELQENLEKLRNSMFSHHKEAQDSSKRLIKYIENDFKVSLNMGIMEHLYSVVSDQRTLHRLAQYERERLSEWGSSSIQSSLKEVLEKSKMRCQAIIETPIEPMRHMIKEEPVEELKKELEKNEESLKSSVKSSVKADSEESESEANDQVLSPLLELSQFSPERQTVHNFSMFAEPMYTPYKEVEMVDYSPFIQEVKQMVLDLQTEITNEIKNLKTNFEVLKNETSATLNDSKQRQNSFIDAQLKKTKEMEFLVSEALHECNMVTSLRKRDLSDLNSSISLLEEKFQVFIAEHSHTENFSADVNQKLSSLTEIIRISLALQQQDEVDREGIALMGQKDFKLKGNLKKPVVTFDKNCMSCTGEKPMVQSLFKMACLAYTPSAVLYSKQEFSRKELIEIQRRMIEGLSGLTQKLEILTAVEEKQKNRARSALSMRRNRPSSVPFAQSNLEVFSSIGSDLPFLSRNYKINP